MATNLSNGFENCKDCAGFFEADGSFPEIGGSIREIGSDFLRMTVASWRLAGTCAVFRAPSRKTKAFFLCRCPQNGVSRAKTVIVTEKPADFCGRDTWRGEQMSCRVVRQIPLYSFLIILAYSGTEKRIQCPPYGTAVQSFDRFSVQW